MEELQKQRLTYLVERRYERKRVISRRSDKRIIGLVISALLAGVALAHFI